MFVISLTSEIYDPNGSFVAAPELDSTLCPYARRVTRTATLDGNSVLEDRGYTAADGTLSIILRVRSMADQERLVRLIRIYPVLRLSTHYGAFRGVVDQYTPSGGTATLRFLVQSQLDL